MKQDIGMLRLFLVVQNEYDPQYTSSVPIQYMLAAFRGKIPAKQLLNYRAAYSGLPGHPELHHPSADFSSGRLGRKFILHESWLAMKYSH
jgi:hypothetical protein